jgi:hypothetical protein
MGGHLYCRDKLYDGASLGKIASRCYHICAHDATCKPFTILSLKPRKPSSNSYLYHRARITKALNPSDSADFSAVYISRCYRILAQSAKQEDAGSLKEVEYVDRGRCYDARTRAATHQFRTIAEGDLSNARPPTRNYRDSAATFNNHRLEATLCVSSYEHIELWDSWKSAISIHIQLAHRALHEVAQQKELWRQGTESRMRDSSLILLDG